VLVSGKKYRGNYVFSQLLHDWGFHQNPLYNLKHLGFKEKSLKTTVKIREIEI